MIFSSAQFNFLIKLLKRVSEPEKIRKRQSLINSTQIFLLTYGVNIHHNNTIIVKQKFLCLLIAYIDMMKVCDRFSIADINYYSREEQLG